MNLLIALAWPSHVHHDNAHSWFVANAARGWATCPLTECGFVRVSSNPAIIREAVSPRQARDVLSRIIGLEHHVFWPDNMSINDPAVVFDTVVGHRQVTDSYLLALAHRHGGKLATLDKKIANLALATTPYSATLEIVPTT